MNTPARILVIAASVLAGAGALAGSAPERLATGRDDIEWAVAPAAASDRNVNLQFSHRTSRISVPLSDDPTLAEARAALESGGAVTFVIGREAGSLTCGGTVKSANAGMGTCRFVPERSFTEYLRARGLAPHDDSEQLAMALLDVDRGLIEGLTGEGLVPRSAQDAIAAAALKVTPEYVGGLKRAGLALSEVADAIACRALGVDAAYVQALAVLGYGPDVQQVIAMKAVGVTPEYVRQMNAAVQK